MTLEVAHFFDESSSTLTYVATDTSVGSCAIIDPVLDLDYASGTLSTESADAIIGFIESRELHLECILETHIHADHISGMKEFDRYDHCNQSTETYLSYDPMRPM